MPRDYKKLYFAELKENQILRELSYAYRQKYESLCKATKTPITKPDFTNL